MKKLLFCTVFCVFSFALQAQVFEGTVYDANTKETIPGVVIYLGGTSIITVSDTDGNFRLEVNQKINADLVFNHLSYNPLVVKSPFERFEKRVFLTEKMNTISEAKVVADQFTWAEKMAVFREQFLGKSPAGKSCVIINENDIIINFDNTTNTLSGYSNRPLVVENKYLAYRITFDLQRFSVQYSARTLNMNKAITVSFSGTASFVDQNPYNIRFKTRRNDKYLRSPQYFWKNFTAGTLEDAHFRLFNRLKKIEVGEYFITVNTPAQKSVLIIPGTNIKRSYERFEEESIYGVIRIMYDNKFTSEVVFLTNRFSFDDFGNPDSIDKLVYFGDMGDQRLGDMLPMDFIYTSLDK